MTEPEPEPEPHRFQKGDRVVIVEPEIEHEWGYKTIGLRGAFVLDDGTTLPIMVDVDDCSRVEPDSHFAMGQTDYITPGSTRAMWFYRDQVQLEIPSPTKDELLELERFMQEL